MTERLKRLAMWHRNEIEWRGGCCVGCGKEDTHRVCEECDELIASTLLAASDAEKTAERIAWKLLPQLMRGDTDHIVCCVRSNEPPFIPYDPIGTWSAESLKAEILAALTSQAKEGDGG